MRVLLIEPDQATSHSVELMLLSESMNVYTTDVGEEGVDLAKLYDYDIVLLELNLPDMSGYEVIRTLRNAKVKTPIMVLSGLSKLEDKVRGLGLGADDYMSKPFHKDELVARVHSIVRRSKGHAESVVKVGDLAVNLDAKSCSVRGQKIHLTGKEYQMMELLALRNGTVLTKEMFLNHIYGGMDEPELKIIDVFICKLRKKLANADLATGGSGKQPIETVWGRGYVLPKDSELKEHAAAFNEAARNGAYGMNGAAHVISKDAIAKEHEELLGQFTQIRAELGLDAGSSMEETMEKLRDYKLKAEKLLEDIVAENVNASGQGAASEEFSEKAKPAKPSFENGLRLPIGHIFKIGTLIEVDTARGVAANIKTMKEASFAPTVGTILEIMAHYQGRDLNKDKLIEYIFEDRRPANQAKLGQYMTQAQGTLTQLVGREFASTLVQVLSGGSYGMPDMKAILTAENKLLMLSAPAAPQYN